MAIKGKAYTKTSWTFAERPVASSKLNSWDDRIEAALELVHFLLAHAWGGGDGVIRGAASDDLAVTALTTPAMAVQVKPGYAFISRYPYKLAAAALTPDVTPPVTHPRIDLVVARLVPWDIAIKSGDEADPPSPPAPDPDTIPLAELHLRPGMSSIKNTDDGVNGYITDVRQYL